MCSSPKLFAAYHVLRRLSVPRHPSCALSSLTTKNFSRLATEAHFLLSTKFSFCSGTKVRPLSSASTCSVLAAFFKTLYNIFNFQSTCRSHGIFIRLRTNPNGGAEGDRTLDLMLAKHALWPTELQPRSGWWAYLDLNQGPRPYQGRALTN